MQTIGLKMHSSILWFLLAINAVCGVHVSNCPANLQQGNTLKVYQDHCYEFNLHHLTDWPHAANDCKSRGGTLVVVNDLAEQDFIISALKLFPFHGRGIWIGYTDAEKEGTWKWVTGETSTFTYWASGEPSRRRRFLLDADEDCAIMKYSDPAGHWNDIPCVKQDPLGLIHERYPYVCEYLQRAATTTQPANADTSQPSTVPSTAA